MKTEISILLAAACISGCSTSGPFKGEEFDKARKKETQPFTVRVEVKQDLKVASPVAEATESDGALTPPMIVNPEQREAIEAAVVEALEKYNAFALAYQGEGQNLTPDLDLVIEISASPRSEMNTAKNNKMYYNLFLWLLAGFPGYIMADTEVAPNVSIEYTLSRSFAGDATQGEEIQTIDLSVGEVQQLNFFDRAGAWQYVQNIVIPPPFVASNEAVADESLYENFVEKIQRGLGRSIKQELAGWQMDKEGRPLPVVQVFSDGTTGRTLVFLFSDRPEAGSAIESHSGKNDLEWIDLNSSEGEEFIERRMPDVKKMGSEALTKAYTMFKDEEYQQGYVAERGTKELLWDRDGPLTRILVRFRGDDRVWSWTPATSRPVREG